MITYHPATDFYHCWMRLAAVIGEWEDDSVEFDRIRIIDFYLCFPKAIEKCRLPQKFSGKLRKLARAMPAGYENPHSVRQAFFQMKGVQVHAIADMVSKGIIQRSTDRSGTIAFESEVREGLLGKVAENWDMANSDYFKTLIPALSVLTLDGNGGLKDRSGLLEFRYDK